LFDLCSLKARIKWLFRSLKGRLAARRYKKIDRVFDPSATLVAIVKTDGVSGLARAYRYELSRRLDGIDSGHMQASGSTFLILGQPRSYRKLLKNPPDGFDAGYRIGFWVTEFEKIPPDWRFAFDIVHEIWTPSHFCAQAIRSQTDLPVKVVPYAVSIPDVPGMDRMLFGLRSDQFLGLAIMDLRTCPERKNPIGHVRAWRRAFGDDPGAHLLMKVRFGRRSRFVKDQLLGEIGDATNISLTEAVFDALNMTAFQKMADVYLSLHRSEGYGLNIREMLEIGVPTIATGWSGNVDFMPLYPHAVSIPFSFVPYSEPTFHYEGDNLRWADADLDAAAEALSRIRQQWRDAQDRCAQVAGGEVP
jgi:hypothetical protein